MAAVTQLGYMGFEVSDLAAWEHFGTKVLGLAIARRDDDGGFALRMDGHQYRFFVTPGDADDVSVFGWQVDDAAALSEVVGRLEAAGVSVTGGTDAEAAARGVQQLVKFADPAGNPCELYWGPAVAEAPFSSDVTRSGFVADDMGLGHCVVTATSQADAHEFYGNVLGFNLSDHIRCDLQGYKVDIEFMHVPGAAARHHTVAFGAGQQKRIHHFMLEVRSLDDVGLCLDRTLRARLRLAQTIGRHPNDRMVSFYAHTPSGFQFEFGWGGRTVDDDSWQPTEYDHISEWGHMPPQFLVPRKPKRD